MTHRASNSGQRYSSSGGQAVDSVLSRILGVLIDRVQFVRISLGKSERWSVSIEILENDLDKTLGNAHTSSRQLPNDLLTIRNGDMHTSLPSFLIGRGHLTRILTNRLTTYNLAQNARFSLSDAQDASESTLRWFREALSSRKPDNVDGHLTQMCRRYTETHEPLAYILGDYVQLEIMKTSTNHGAQKLNLSES